MNMYHRHHEQQGQGWGEPRPWGDWPGRPMCGCRGRHHRHHPGPAMGKEFWPGGGFHRRFLTRAERIERLEAYLQALQAEAKAVEERLAALRAEQ